MNTSTANPEADRHTQPRPETQAGPGAQAQPLRRSAQDRMLAGVAGGLASYLGVDATVVRIVLAVLTVAGGTGVPIYLASWLLIPEEGCEQSIAAEFIQSRQDRSR